MNNIIWNDEENKISMEFLGSTGGYDNYLIIVKSNIFNGGTHFCIFNEKIKSIIKIDINSLNVNEYIIIDDYDSDSFIKFTVSDTLGKITVNGFIGGSHRKNNMKFEFQADQTILQILIKLLKSNIKL